MNGDGDPDPEVVLGRLPQREILERVPLSPGWRLVVLPVSCAFEREYLGIRVFAELDNTWTALRRGVDGVWLASNMPRERNWIQFPDPIEAMGAIDTYENLHGFPKLTGSTSIDEERDVNNPPHYTSTPYQPDDVIAAWGLDYNVGSALQYIARSKFKGAELLDLKKALWHLKRAVERRENRGS